MLVQISMLILLCIVHRSGSSVEMKFKFCNDGDCPLWALAALHALGSLPAQLFRALLEKVLDDQPDDGVMEILKDTSLGSREESARAAAVIRWTLRSAWSCSCPGTQLARDLAVLGVPKTHAAALADAADEGRAAYVERANDTSIVTKLTDVAISPGPEGTIDCYKLTFETEAVSGDQSRKEVLIDKTQAGTLLVELKKVYKKIEEVEASGLVG